MGAGFLAVEQIGPGVKLSFLYDGYRVFFSGSKVAGVWL